MKQRRLRVVFDVDGVLAGFTEGLRDALAVHGVKLPALGRWDFFKDMDTEERELAYRLIESRGFCRNLPPLPDEATLRANMDRVREVADVVLATSPWDSSDYWVNERREWVTDHLGIPGGDVVFCRNKAHVHGEVFVDDKRSNVAEWQAMHWQGVGFLWPHSHNRTADPADGDRFDGLPQLREASPWDHLFEVIHAGIQATGQRLGLEAENARLREENASLRQRLAKAARFGGSL